MKKKWVIVIALATAAIGLIQFTLHLGLPSQKENHFCIRGSQILLSGRAEIHWVHIL